MRERVGKEEQEKKETVLNKCGHLKCKNKKKNKKKKQSRTNQLDANKATAWMWDRRGGE